MSTSPTSDAVSRDSSVVGAGTHPAVEKMTPTTSNNDILNPAAENEIRTLARVYTSQSHKSHATCHAGQLFPIPPGSALDPSSEQFDARRWTRAFYELRNQDTPLRTSGIAFKDLNVHGFGTTTDFQKTVGNVVLDVASTLTKTLFRRTPKQRIDILQGVEGVVEAGEMLAVLGPPGSGCSTLLKTIAGDTYGFHVDAASALNYQGISPDDMKTLFRGEAIYTAEVDAHFPHMTVGDTLYFAARARSPRHLSPGDEISRQQYAEHLRDVTMAMFGISHTLNTRVGDDFVRGVSGGERKRVTIAEAALSYAPLQCWDNSTRGLDSANALEFCRALRCQSDVLKTTACVSLYQASQAAYDVFDKVVLLYQGHQIFFGKTSEAKAYFEDLGFVCPEQQTTADFLTSMTSHTERVIRPGFEHSVPRSPDEFAQRWKASSIRARVVGEVDVYLQDNPFGGDKYHAFLKSRRHDQSPSQRSRSPFMLSYWGQIKLTLWRSWRMLLGDPSTVITMLVLNLFQALIVSSIFYNLPATTVAILRRCMVLFFIILMNAMVNILEILTLYSKRRIVEKHARYALYHPSAEAIAHMICDLPYKVTNTLMMSIIMYFMTNLRRDDGAGPFFFFVLLIFLMNLTLSMMFRFIGSLTRTIAEALAPASVLLLIVSLYTGFVLRIRNMQVWLGWLRWINPLHYGFESLMCNEFAGRDYSCSTFIPSGGLYDSVDPDMRVCSSVGALPGEDFIRGTRYLEVSYGFSNAHRWRNVGIVIVFIIFFLACHLVAAEYVASQKSKGEVLVFTRKAMRGLGQKTISNSSSSSSDDDVEAQDNGQKSVLADEVSDGPASGIESQTSIFHWANVCYEVKVKGETRQILDNVDGWVKPGTLTALMGVSGAGKTTLLDCLASRTTMGVVTGQMLVDGHPRDPSFQRKTGYVTQQDLHLHTSTVREALTFSALLRQPATYTRAEKIAYVDTVINLLDMQEYSDAVIGVPGEGLNVEQRKRLTIGVELAARPQLLLFLDEPTSGLDSQTSWSVCNLMEKLTKNGQAILCTIHQPSAILFQRFDRLLLLAKGGRTVYFGDIGKNSTVLVDYLTRNGAPKCPEDANPAEYMLETINNKAELDWPAIWRQSPEYQGVQAELQRLASDKKPSPVPVNKDDVAAHSEFAVSFNQQFNQVLKRVVQQYWRSPSYIYSKAFLSIGAALFIGLSFVNADNTVTGLQNQMFGVFIFLTIFSQLVDQIQPVFVTQRASYEARERPAKTYSWKAFLAANMAVEMFWNTIMSVFSFLVWYFPMGLYRNARQANAEHSRGITIALFVWAFFVFTTTFAHMVMAGLESPEIAGGVVGLLTIMMFTFCGIGVGPDDMPRFWIFMYRVNPFTYFVEGFIGTAISGAKAYCDPSEFISFNPLNGTTCGDYMSAYMDVAGGYLSNPDAVSDCNFCEITETDQFLKVVHMDFGNRWRDFSVLWAFVAFNIVATAFLFWLARVPKVKKDKKE